MTHVCVQSSSFRELIKKSHRGGKKGCRCSGGNEEAVSSCFFSWQLFVGCPHHDCIQAFSQIAWDTFRWLLSYLSKQKKMEYKEQRLAIL